jgi:hypothetical protein
MLVDGFCCVDLHRTVNHPIAPPSLSSGPNCCYTQNREAPSFPLYSRVPSNWNHPRSAAHRVTTQILKQVDFVHRSADAPKPVNLAAEIAEQFGFHVSRTTVNMIMSGLRFKYRSVRHNQTLHPNHIEPQVAFCEKMLCMPECLNKIHFSDDSRLVLGDNKP